MIGKMLIDVPYITMVNLVCEEKVFEEFLQGDVNGKELSKALEKILPGGSRREDVMRGIDKCISRLGAGKEASVRAAEIVLNEISTGALDG